jgi:hypothetical protein
VPQDWYLGLKVAALPHTAGLCPDGLTAGHPSDMGAPTISVPGEPAPLWLLTMTCFGGDSSHPMPVEVFRYSPQGPQLVQTLAYQPGDPRAITVTAITVEGSRLVLAEKGYSPADPPCCRSLRFSQDFTWSTAASRFVAGPQVDTAPTCAGDQLAMTGSALAGPDGDVRGVLLSYVNNGEQPCTLTGYPVARIVDTAGQPLADAARTPAGPLGGLTGGEAPRVVLSGSATPASAVIEWSTVQREGSRCHPQAELLFAPPGATDTDTFGAQALVCDLQVHPVVAGDTGRQQPVDP